MMRRDLTDRDRTILLNDFAVRSFRDVADYDYIGARLAYRTNLFSQFRWLALQAIEKYLKALLLFNRIPARKVGHDLAKALALTAKLPFELQLSSKSLEFITYLNDSARFRYLEGSYVVRGPKLIELDRTVWDLRRYCRPLNYEIPRSDGTLQNVLIMELAAIRAAESRPRHRFRIIAGQLEKILDKRTHPARPGLIWNNMFFGAATRHRVRMRITNVFENAPLWLHPEILDDVCRYVFLPKEVIEAYRVEIGKRRIGT